MDPILLEPVLPTWGPVPVDRPFTWAEAKARRVTRRRLLVWEKAGLLCHPVRDVYHASHLPDTLALRLACLRLVVPADAVVTDRTAAWAHGAPMVLAPGDHLRTPLVSLHFPAGRRSRNPLTDSGERTLLARDVERRDGLLVTTPLRTACDLGRLLHRDQAMAALDQMVRIGDLHPEVLLAELERFRGFRGVIQLRDLAQWVDARSQSPGESIVRLRWRDHCPDLPQPVPQVAVRGPRGMLYLDLAVEELRYAVEYDGAAWHGPDRRRHDEQRRGWIRRRHGYLIDVLTAADIHGPQQDVEGILRRGVDRARRRLGRAA